MPAPIRRRKVPRCIVPDCTKQAQTRRLCKAYGGGVRCRAPNCSKLAQSQRLCVAHGGGRYCQFTGCSKHAQCKGLCLAHGGGRRCRAPGCLKYVQVRGWCKAHFNLVNQASEAPRPSPGNSSQKEGKLDHCTLAAVTPSNKVLATPGTEDVFNSPTTPAPVWLAVNSSGSESEYAASWVEDTLPLSSQVEVDLEPWPPQYTPLELYRPACRQVYCQRRKVYPP